MKLKNSNEFRDAIRAADRSQAQVARAAEVSRQFVQQLCAGTKTTCTPHVAARIEVFLQVPKGDLFVDSKTNLVPQ
ncbi:helix-turn-helix transcriptional regulator [Labedaea rhizosphaerae]|uniref:Helix-turn-helix protein n=1 Tax=Labedaea rhizosphaerae TaxID=598644 RepID=A0A4R6SCP1_LABRH|nr:helix-turn-helix transcriptional regulator [Labedaea rhizosphaerae]TDP97680.1 helix-turn-helix protein [Labedaea rhizosphaerae]